MEAEERVATGQLLLQSFYEERERQLRLHGAHHAAQPPTGAGAPRSAAAHAREPWGAAPAAGPVQPRGADHCGAAQPGAHERTALVAGDGGGAAGRAGAAVEGGPAAAPAHAADGCASSSGSWDGGSGSASAGARSGRGAAGDPPHAASAHPLAAPLAEQVSGAHRAAPGVPEAGHPGAAQQAQEERTPEGEPLGSAQGCFAGSTRAGALGGQGPAWGTSGTAWSGAEAGTWRGRPAVRSWRAPGAPAWPAAQGHGLAPAGAAPLGPLGPGPPAAELAFVSTASGAGAGAGGPLLEAPPGELAFVSVRDTGGAEVPPDWV